MSSDHKIVNPARREYLDPYCMLWSPEYPRVLEGPPGLAANLLLLGWAPQGVRNGLAGCWCGDRVLLASDTDLPDTFGISTATAEDPRRNLYWLADQEYTDLSWSALDLVAATVPRLAHEWRDRLAGGDAAVLGRLGTAALRVHAPVLTSLLEGVFGPAWKKRYQEIVDSDSALGKAAIPRWWARPCA